MYGMSFEKGAGTVVVVVVRGWVWVLRVAAAGGAGERLGCGGPPC